MEKFRRTLSSKSARHASQRRLKRILNEAIALKHDLDDSNPEFIQNNDLGLFYEELTDLIEELPNTIKQS